MIPVSPRQASQPEDTHLLVKGILLFQLLKEPDTKTSFPTPVHRNTVGLSATGPLSLASMSCRQAKNSSFSIGAYVSRGGKL